MREIDPVTIVRRNFDRMLSIWPAAGDALISPLDGSGIWPSLLVGEYETTHALTLLYEELIWFRVLQDISTESIQHDRGNRSLRTLLIDSSFFEDFLPDPGQQQWKGSVGFKIQYHLKCF